jgi:beta-phosphoglucomutase-like phosphatase (HAD superfamily)
MSNLAHTTPIQAVIFDCDGTLVDSETLGGRAMYETAAKYGCTLDEHTLVQACLGSNMLLSIEMMNRHSPTPMPECFAPEVRALMADKFQKELVEIAGAKALLTELVARGIPFAMATNGPRAKAELTLGLTGLLPFFQTPAKHPPLKADGSPCQDRLFSAYEFDTFKPDPQLFELSAAALGVPFRACAAVEDSLSGLRAGVAANMQVFSVVPLAHIKGASEALAPLPTELAGLLELLDFVPQ